MSCALLGSHRVLRHLGDDLESCLWITIQFATRRLTLKTDIVLGHIEALFTDASWSYTLKGRVGGWIKRLVLFDRDDVCHWRRGLTFPGNEVMQDLIPALVRALEVSVKRSELAHRLENWLSHPEASPSTSPRCECCG
mgnify:FL=1